MTKLCQCCSKRFFCKEVDTKEKCKNFVRYQTDRGICECFGFHDLNMIEEQEKPDRKIYNDGMMIL